MTSSLTTSLQKLTGDNLSEEEEAQTVLQRIIFFRAEFHREAAARRCSIHPMTLVLPSDRYRDMNYSNQMFTTQKLPVDTKCKSDKIFCLEYNHLSVQEFYLLLLFFIFRNTGLIVLYFSFLTLTLSHDFPSSLMGRGSGQPVKCIETKQEETNSSP